MACASPFFRQEESSAKPQAEEAVDAAEIPGWDKVDNSQALLERTDLKSFNITESNLTRMVQEVGSTTCSALCSGKIA